MTAWDWKVNMITTKLQNMKEKHDEVVAERFDVVVASASTR
jgi:hypothetical protein